MSEDWIFFISVLNFLKGGKELHIAHKICIKNANIVEGQIFVSSPTTNSWW